MPVPASAPSPNQRKAMTEWKNKRKKTAVTTSFELKSDPRSIDLDSRKQS